jgi:hypothetical protein
VDLNAVQAGAYGGAMDRDRLTRIAVAVFGVYHGVIGLWLAAAPHSFFRALGGFGPYNRHYAGDNATFELALGLGLLAALGRPAWRAPMLAVTAAQAVLHAINHVVDVGHGHPAWVGVFDAVTLAGLAAGAVWAALVAGRPEGAAP